MDASIDYKTKVIKSLLVLSACFWAWFVRLSCQHVLSAFPVSLSCKLVLSSCSVSFSCLLVLSSCPVSFSCLLVLSSCPVSFSCLLVLSPCPVSFSCLLVLSAFFVCQLLTLYTILSGTRLKISFMHQKHFHSNPKY